MAIKANLTVDQGADFTATIDLKSADGQAYNLTHHLVHAQMRKNPSQSTASASFVCTHNDSLGQITLKLSSGTAALVAESGTRGQAGFTQAQPAQVGTANIEAGRYLYDVEIADNSTPNVVTRVVQGTVTVTAGITK